jgi:hypothetical protein
MANNAITNGNTKCKAKKRFNVALLTEKPPQIQVTNGSPKIGTADKIFVITVAPQ